MRGFQRHFAAHRMEKETLSFDVYHPVPLMVVISGPSGVGKDAVLKSHAGARAAVSLRRHHDQPRAARERGGAGWIISSPRAKISKR